MPAHDSNAHEYEEICLLKTVSERIKQGNYCNYRNSELQNEGSATFSNTSMMAKPVEKMAAISGVVPLSVRLSHAA